MPAYLPETIDTSNIELTADLQELVEKLAQNNHDHWARKRIDEGWRYGVERNDSRREHPDLVPYMQLPESEKIKAADYVIDNSGSLDHTQEQVRQLWEKLHSEALAKRLEN